MQRHLHPFRREIHPARVVRIYNNFAPSLVPRSMQLPNRRSWSGEANCTNSTKLGIVCMGHLKRGGYLFLTWVGDHPPRHVHIYRGQKLVARFDQESRRAMKGGVSRKLLKILKQLEREGRL